MPDNSWERASRSRWVKQVVASGEYEGGERERDGEITEDYVDQWIKQAESRRMKKKSKGGRRRKGRPGGETLLRPREPGGPFR